REIGSFADVESIPLSAVVQPGVDEIPRRRREDLAERIDVIGIASARAPYPEHQTFIRHDGSPLWQDDTSGGSQAYAEAARRDLDLASGSGTDPSSAPLNAAEREKMQR